MNRVGNPVCFTGFIDCVDSSTVAVQFSLDDGETWVTYPVQDASFDGGVSWRYSYTPPQAGFYELKVRSVGSDNTPSGYISRILFEVEE